jgi:hypothetical protein
MKNFLSIFAIFSLTGILNTSTAQEYQMTPPPPPSQEYNTVAPTGYFALSLGIAQPIGSFASQPTTGYGGYALTGDNINLSIGIPINHSNFGIAFMFGSFVNDFDMNTYVSNAAISDPSKNYQPFEQDVYDESFILAGLFATYPINRLSIDVRIMGGVSFCYLPEVDYGAAVYDPTISDYDNYEWDTYSSRSTSFALAAGADLRYKVRRFSLMLGVDFLTTDPTVNTEQQYTDPNGNYSYTHITGKVPISIISTSLGIAYQIR